MLLNVIRAQTERLLEEMPTLAIKTLEFGWLRQAMVVKNLLFKCPQLVILNWYNSLSSTCGKRPEYHALSLTHEMANPVRSELLPYQNQGLKT